MRKQFSLFVASAIHVLYPGTERGQWKPVGGRRSICIYAQHDSSSISTKTRGKTNATTTAILRMSCGDLYQLSAAATAAAAAATTSPNVPSHGERFVVVVVFCVLPVFCQGVFLLTTEPTPRCGAHVTQEHRDFNVKQ